MPSTPEKQRDSIHKGCITHLMRLKSTEYDQGNQNSKELLASTQGRARRKTTYKGTAACVWGTGLGSNF
jgi:hypothetical protein